MFATDNLRAAADLVGMLLSSPRLGVLVALLLVAAWIDLRTRRIPNVLVAAGLVWALGFNALHTSYVTGGVGLIAALEAAAIGFGLTFPLHLLRGMAAGDVKLMTMACAFLDPWDALHAVLWSFVAGGVLALAWVSVRGRAVQLARNAVQAAQGASMQIVAGVAPTRSIASVGAFPYGVAIAAGTIAFVVARQLGLVDYV